MSDRTNQHAGLNDLADGATAAVSGAAETMAPTMTDAEMEAYQQTPTYRILEIANYVYQVEACLNSANLIMGEPLEHDEINRLHGLITAAQTCMDEIAKLANCR